MTSSNENTTIVAIEHVNDDNTDDPKCPGKRLRWECYRFIMSDPTKNITCKIDNQSQCCETFGIHVILNSSHVGLEYYVGASYSDVNVEQPLPYNTNDGECAMNLINVNIITDRGSIKCQLYNEHNGYYSHDVYILTEKHDLLKCI